MNNERRIITAYDTKVLDQKLAPLPQVSRRSFFVLCAAGGGVLSLTFRKELERQLDFLLAANPLRQDELSRQTGIGLRARHATSEEYFYAEARGMPRTTHTVSSGQDILYSVAVVDPNGRIAKRMGSGLSIVDIFAFGIVPTGTWIVVSDAEGVIEYRKMRNFQADESAYLFVTDGRSITYHAKVTRKPRSTFEIVLLTQKVIPVLPGEMMHPPVNIPVQRQEVKP